MASNETVADILRMMRDARNLDPSAIEDNNRLLSDRFYDDECQGWLSSYADRIEAAHKREILRERHLIDEYLAVTDAKIEKLRDTINMDSASMAGKDAVIAAKDAEIARLKAALKPVLDCELHIGDSLTEAVGEIGTSSKYGVCDEEGSDLWDKDIADNLNAVREAQRIFKQQ